MPYASTEPTAAPRAQPQAASMRDKREAGTGFASLVDDNAAAKAEAPRPSPQTPPRSNDAPPGRETPPVAPPADRKAANNAARAATALGAPTKPTSTQPPAGDQSEAPQIATTDDGSAETAPAAPESETAATAPAVDPSVLVAAPASTNDMPAPAAAPATAPPAAVAVPLPVPQQVVAPIPQQASAPLAIAAAGLAAAKSVAAKPTNDNATSAAPATPAAVTAEPAMASETAPAMPDFSLPPGGATVGTSLPPGIKLSGKAETPTVAPAATTAPETAASALPKAEGKAEAQVVAKPDGTNAAPVAADGGDAAAPAKPSERHAALAANVTDTAVPAPAITVPQTAHHTVNAPSPTVQLTAAVTTAQPVPLSGLAVELAARANAGATRFEIRLDPAELGRIDVRIDIDRHGQVTSHLTVEKPETLAMLRQDSPQLQRALNDAGFKTSDGGMQFSLGDQSQSQSQAQQQNADNSQRQAHRLFIQDDDQAAPTMPIRDYGRLSAARSGVDISV